MSRPRALLLDIYCRPCQAAGEDHRLARFWRDADGAVGAEPFSDKGPWRKPYGLGPQPRRRWPANHKRPDGGQTWDLRCPKGHTKPIQHQRIVAAFEAFPPGLETWRIAL
jgi:hypothetical protein